MFSDCAQSYRKGGYPVGVEKQVDQLQAEELELDSYMEDMFIKKYLDRIVVEDKG
jgi:hypothetical protein